MLYIALQDSHKNISMWEIAIQGKLHIKFLSKERASKQNTMEVSAYIILNPVAGKGDPDEIKATLARAQSEHRLRYDLYETTGKEDLREIVRDAITGKNYDLIIACGGDGTVSGVADALADSGVPMGILSTGTTNAFATELGIPETLSEALELLVEGHRIKTVDAIQFGDRLFILEASLGVFSASFDEVEREKKDRLGWLAFVDTTIRNWVGLDPLWVSLIVDGERFAFRASEVALFNTSQVGIIKADLDAEIRLDDGVLDLYALRSKTLWDVLRMLVYRILGKPKKAPYIQYWPVKTMARIETNPTVIFQADGDVQGKTPATFKVAPRVLKVIVPESPEV